MTIKKTTTDTRERNFDLVKRKIKALSSKSMKVLDASLLGDETITSQQILSAGEILKLNTLLYCSQEHGFDLV